MPAPEPAEVAIRRFRLDVQAEIRAALEETGLLLSRPELTRWRENCDRQGARLFHAYLDRCDEAERDHWQRASAALSIPLAALYRIVGFGARQTEALASTPPPDGAVLAGALFNLGIVLFDCLIDRGGDEARAARAFDDSTLAQLASGRGPSRLPISSPLFAFFLSVARAHFRAAGKAHAVSPDRMKKMLSAQTLAGLADARSSISELRHMRRKSVWPFLALVEIGATPDRPVEFDRAAAFGRAIWIVDDLWDLPEDWQSGTSNRICWHALRIDAGGDVDLGRFLDRHASNCLVRECQRLRASLRAYVERTPWPSDRDCLAATIQAWVGTS